MTEINPCTDSHLLVIPACVAMVLRCHGLYNKDAYKQISAYMKETEQVFDCKTVKGIIVCSGIHTVFEDFYLKKTQEGKIDVYQYGWRFDAQPYSSL